MSVSRPASRIAASEPMSSINITPMIDVMLVLLVMLILTIPLKTHKVPIELPGPVPATVSDTPHRLDIGATGALRWDGHDIADVDLPRLLSSVSEGAGVLHMRTDPAARYERFDAVLATVKRANVTRLGFIGDASFADFGKPIQE